MIEKPKAKITISKNGPYEVIGEIPLVRKSQIVSEFGEPLTWHKEFTYGDRPGCVLSMSLWKLTKPPIL